MSLTNRAASRTVDNGESGNATEALVPTSSFQLEMSGNSTIRRRGPSTSANRVNSELRVPGLSRTSHRSGTSRASSIFGPVGPSLTLGPATTLAEETVLDAEGVVHAPEAEWYHVIFHVVTAFVGAGVLALPNAMAALGWAPGMIFLIFAGLVAGHAAWSMANMHVIEGVRQNTYLALGTTLLGEKLGFWCVIPFQLAVCIGTAIAYVITGGQSLRNVYLLLAPATSTVRLVVWQAVFVALEIPLSQVPDFHSLWVVSLVGGVMSVCYCTIAFIAPLVEGKEGPVSYDYAGGSTSAMVFNAFGALGNVAFAYGGHCVLLEIQATLKPDNPPPQKSMVKGLSVAYTFILVGYAGVAASGYAIYGNTVDGDVLSSIGKPVPLIVIANIMVFLHVVAAWQVFTQPVYEYVEAFFVDRGWVKPAGYFWFKLIWRTTYTCINGAVGMCLPFFSDLMGLIGAIGLTPQVFVMPSVFLIVYREGKRDLYYVFNLCIAVLFTFIGIAAAIGATRNIITNISSYSFFSK